MSLEANTLFATQSFAFPHKSLSDAINGNLIQSEIEGGVHMEDLDPGDVLVIETRNTNYRLVNHGRGQVLISGHPEFCPDPVLVTVEGSNWGGSILKAGYIGRGMCLEFRHPVFQTVTTSPVLRISQIL